MNKRLIDFQNLIERDYSNIAGIVVMQDGERVYEGYFDGYTAVDRIHVASVTKSITSALIGIAIDKGFIKSIDQKVLEFFPDYTLKRVEKMLQNITIKNMLTMTAPYKYKSEPYTKVYSSDDWTRAVLDLLGGKSGCREFQYSTIGMQVLSGVIVNATGESVLDFATRNLFKPLGMQIPHHVSIDTKEAYLSFLRGRQVSGWVADPQGVNTSGWGLCLTTRDMAKFGQLYLNGGLWGDKRILSSK